MLTLIVTGVLLAFKQSALLSILGGAVSGILVAIFYQGMGLADAFNVFYNGFACGVLIYSVLKFKTDRIYEDEGYVDVSARLAADPAKQKEISGSLY